MSKIKYQCGCVMKLIKDDQLIFCCNKHKKIESQEELMLILSEEYSEYKA